MGNDDEDRSAILRRRRFFIATAVAGIAVTQCDNAARPCLNVSVVDSGTVTPTVCLSVPVSPPDAATTPVTPTGPDAGSDAAPPRPSVCLSPVKRPPAKSDG